MKTQFLALFVIVNVWGQIYADGLKNSSISINNKTDPLPDVTDVSPPASTSVPTTTKPTDPPTTKPTTLTTTTSKPTTPTTTTTTTTTTPTPSTSKTTPSTPTTTKPTNPTPKPTIAPTSSSTKVAPTVTTPTPTPASNRKFDGPSFVGGIVLASGLMAIGFVAFKFYKARTELNYHTL